MSRGSNFDPKEYARRLIHDCSLFRGLPEASRNELVGRAHIKTFKRRDIIFRSGDNGDSLVIVLRGTLRVSVSAPDGREILLASLGPGELVGELAVLDGRERTGDVTAQSDCTLALLDRRDILSFFEREPVAWRAIVQVLCARLRNTDRHIAEIALLDLSARLAKTLLRMASPIEAASTKIDILVSQRELGEMVGASRESINKCLAQWQRSKILEIAGTTITIVRPDALRAMADAG